MSGLKKIKSLFIPFSSSQVNVSEYDIKRSKNSRGGDRFTTVPRSTHPIGLSFTQKGFAPIRKPKPIVIKTQLVGDEENIMDFDVTHDVPKKKGKTQHDMMSDWLIHEEEYFNILLGQESLYYGPRTCICSSQEAIFVCTNCHGDISYCSRCIVQIHKYTPFHKIKKWNSLFLEDVSLSSLGLVTYFGHGGDPCPLAAATMPLLVVHIDGFHTITAAFCRCTSSSTPDLQLFQSRMFPATIHSPKTAFTFDVLENYRLNHLEGKASAYSYIQSLYRLTDDEGSREIPDRVREFRRIARLWSYLITRKRTGRYGLYRLSQPLTFRCPACPRPGINIPLDWRERWPTDKHWLAQRINHFDANFRLVLARRENRDSGDRKLWNGPGFFVNSDIYAKYLKAAGEVLQEKSNCVNHRAVLMTTMCRNDRLEVTGVAGGVCRHECAIPNAFVNLYKGERYVYSDFAISNLLVDVNDGQEAVLSYDIACQYERNFHSRFSKHPNFLCDPTRIALRFMVPKFHLPAHQQECRNHYSLTFAKHVARTDGEAIERLWSLLNYLAGSTSQMTPSACEDVLNSKLNDCNWVKTCKMASTLAQRVSNARAMLSEHQRLFDELKRGLQVSKVEEWTTLEDQYVSTRGTKSIYEAMTEKAPTRQEILVRLADSGSEPGPSGNTNSSQPTLPLWINDGINIEEAQGQLQSDAKALGRNSTEGQLSAIEERRTNLLNTVNQWKARAPNGIDLNDDDDDDELVELQRLPLPSSMLTADQSPEARAVEKNLREAQAFELLQSLRKLLAERVALQRNQQKDQQGQNARTRSSCIINRVSEEIRRIVKRYQTNYRALEALGALPHPTLQELKDGDATATNVFNITERIGRGTDTNVSWIWRQVPIGEDVQSDSWLEEVLRVQFLEAKVNRDRWAEECELSMGELHFTLGTFTYMDNYWSTRAKKSHSPGEMAHGYYMGNMYRVMASQVRAKIDFLEPKATVKPQ